MDEVVRANTRLGAGAEERAAHRLILDAATDRRRALTPEELARVLGHVARAGFDPQALERARGNLVGLDRPGGGVVQRREALPPAEIHYLRHVLAQPEWPAGTTFAAYVASLHQVAADPDSGVLVSRYRGAWQVGLVRESRALRGPAGHAWLLVEYRLVTGYWVTAYQPRGGLAALGPFYREERRWLRAPISSVSTA